MELELKEVKKEMKNMEEYQKKQQQTIDDLTEKMRVSIEQFSLKQQEQEKKQKEQQQNIVDLQKTVVVLREIGLIPLNRWDSAACHRNLALIKPKQLVVQRNGKNSVRSSVMAEKPMLENPYFEVKILKAAVAIHIGLATKQMPLDKCVGCFNGTYGYGNYGTFWGHTVEGCSNTAKRRSYIKGNPEFKKGNIVGCGVNLKNGQIIYTKNGERLDTDGLVVNSAVDLFPCATLFLPDDKIEANFGPDFKYKF